ncbi:sugar phosphate nucleotidyltransferase [Faecalicoccus pleomorphus]|uniref:sugar phosphate nucleotidyltransferase n=1 Tax=Faecalicoccus pleomorphus TaxID=1323 RepID=UPI001960CE07|nr:sugar phosphate nucleotidyltransferase [Faecalicoccus pleomorphus]MBM6766294.1 cupin domain-containing protein [Faecalicoccus pleomorphus]MDB7987535.1 sugar phosphate nucleotidyltransferase [Faecalicoccus pleomorphus]MDB7992059.1 sugar phosphate nucleotidyltransferase [Faecalicoccus pleomorphus]
MNIILLSGGSGKRLWPLSNEIRSKQFIKLFKHNDQYESMVQRVYRQIKSVDKDADITIATSKTQVSSIHNQLGNDVSISIEPCRRDTFPAIVLATAYLHDIKDIDLDETVVVCPVDPHVDDSYFEMIKKMDDLAKEGSSNLYLMGIEPDHPSEKFGYIIPTSKDEISKVSEFKEKPTEEIAKKYIEQGALWNGGVFAYKIGYVLEIAHKLIDFVDYQDLFEKYEEVNKISFDYAVAEREKDITVVRYTGQWKDLGTWDAFVNAMEDESIGNAIIDSNCKNVHVINELDIPILCVGLQDIVVSASPDGILVSDKEKSTGIKSLVDSIEGPIMFAEKSWGEYRVIDVEDESRTIKVTLRKGHQMNYHSHEHRNEVWTIVSGIGIATVNGRKYELVPGDTIKLPVGCKHTIYAKTDLQLIEVQSGKEITVKDKIKYSLKTM